MKSTRLKRFDYSRQNQAYFFTLRFINPMSNGVLRALYKNLLKLFDESGFACDALVVMPDHVHLVTHKNVESRERLGDLVRVLKSKSLYLLKKVHLVDRTFWQRGYYEHVIRNEEDWQEKVNYTINNPIKAGLATLPWDYPYLFVGGLINGVEQGHPLSGGKDVGTFLL
jgi:putative transposase